MLVIDIKFILLALAAFVLSSVISFAATPLVKRLAHKVGAVDVPNDERRMHKVPTPRMGGLAIFLAFLFSVLLFVDITVQLRGILIGAVVIVVLGIVDDIVPLPALFKFAVQIVAAYIVVAHGTVISTFTNPNVFSASPFIDLGNWGIPVTIFWIVAITNAVNLIDGLDGLAVGVSSISAFSLLLIAIVLPEYNIALLMAALAGACIGFMPYNLSPAKIFMGDTGSTFLGFLLACVSIQGLFKFYAIVSFAVPFLIVGLPLFDTIFTFSRRIMKGQNPMKADRLHVHHRLVDMGFSQKETVTILYIMSGLLGLAAVVLATTGEFRFLLLILAFCLAFILGGKAYIESKKSKEEAEKKKAEEKSEE
ncbi:MAG: undecaprenyl/decaprenyl-phosphate alpha-N-acetylglucosaminyl 1-phosphate transferase [Clostridia bacterium]|nr:undecaprenyl/decaprenyl-phosphate alpha-N-acetylglucosaminyl 1-phosphate transferase [Clostridia bacterium]